MITKIAVAISSFNRVIPHVTALKLSFPIMFVRAINIQCLERQRLLFVLEKDCQIEVSSTTQT